MTKLALGVLIALVCLSLATPAVAYSVSGYVKLFSDEPVKNAQVSNNITSDIVITDATGFYVLNLSDGTYRITASKQGYTTNSTAITVSGADITNVNITLATLYTDYELDYQQFLIERGKATLWLFLGLLGLDFALILFFFRNTRNRIYGNIVIGLFSVFLTFILAHRALLYPIEMPDLAMFLNGVAVIMVIYSVLLIIEVVIERLRGSIQ
ncbi:MAG: hypothetical protein DRP09_21635 [Candidatus Thorarchaeota archaeon]|nr:MAG: hypothetical protein DRP09_21635 [Candidatus Thorarchaeota archaeon]